MTVNTAGPSFVHALHRALVCLYDPGELRRSPLVGLFSIDRQQNPASTLQRILMDAIEALKPGADVPSHSSAWRAYRILFHRYTEQCTQVEVAATLALSERQLRREEHAAVRLLADHLWTRYGVQLRMAAPPDGSACPWRRRHRAGGSMPSCRLQDATRQDARPLPHGRRSRRRRAGGLSTSSGFPGQRKA